MSSSSSSSSSCSSDFFGTTDVTFESLQGESNFHSWKMTITMYLDIFGLWEVVSGAEPRPAATEPEVPTAPASASGAAAALEAKQNAWDQTSLKAILFLHKHVERDIKSSVSACRTAPEMWKALMDRYNRRNIMALLEVFRSIVTLRYSDNGQYSIAEHVATFERHWYQLVCRTDDATAPAAGDQKSIEMIFKLLAADGDSKATLFIGSLPPSMDNIMDNLRIRHGKSLTYHHVCHRLMDLHFVREKQEKREQVSALSQASKKQDMNCTWCKSRGFSSAGHTWKRCRRLTEFKKKEKARTPVLW